VPGADAITERSALELARAIRERELTATDVVEAHIARHERFGPRINAVVADRFELARAEAAAVDERIAAAGEDRSGLPPLLGVPFTVKESIALTGMPQAAGIVARRDYRSTDSATAVQRLIDAGAIPIGVTNTSELTLWIESSNRLYGRTSTPYDPGRTAGGSSGGEGAAVGSGGSPFGVGTDIGGSIRVPAFFCGVFGHLPSQGVVPNTGTYPPAPGDAGLMLGTGPLARRGEDLMPLLRIMAGPDSHDRLARSVKLGDPASVSLEGLRVTTLEDTTRVPISGELRDARERAVGALLAAGAVVRRVSLRSWRSAVVPYLATLQAGSGTTTLGILTDAGAELPTWRTLIRRGGVHTLPTRIVVASEMLPQLGDSSRDRLVAAGRGLAEELIDAIGDGVLLHPAHHRVTPRHGRTLGRPWLVTPAAMFNLAGLPATEVPLGLSERGLPLGVQVAAGLDRDHVSIAVALELERVFGGWAPPPS
jgi:Asp-tRNA(Asn)/Glu-tRNA(Gln) amidotransferase A subunit family amidase